jgi:hypothetical protein
MDIATLLELKAKYEREVLVAQAKVEVIDDIINTEKSKLVEQEFASTDYATTDNVM